MSTSLLPVQPALQYLDMDAAIKHCTQGIGIWDWAMTKARNQMLLWPVVEIFRQWKPWLPLTLRQHLPDIKIRVINVVDLMVLQPPKHPHGISDKDYEGIFTPDKPIVFAFHGYPWLIHRLTCRPNHENLHVRGYKEEGTTTTPFDMVRTRWIASAWQMTCSIASTYEKAYVKQIIHNKLMIEHSTSTSTAMTCLRFAIEVVLQRSCPQETPGETKEPTAAEETVRSGALMVSTTLLGSKAR